MSTEQLNKLLEFVTDKSADLVIGIIGTVIGFLLGFVLYFKEQSDAKLKEELDTEQRHIDQIRWLAGVFKQLISYAKQQSNELQTFIGELRSDPSENHQLRSIASYASQRLMNPDNAPTFHAYYTLFTHDSDKEESYRELVRVSDFVVAHIALILGKFDRYQQNIYERRLKLKAMIEEVADDLASLHLSMKPGGSQSNYANSWTHQSINIALVFYGKHLIELARPLKDFVNDFVTPLKRTLLVHPHIEGADSLLIKCKRINTAFSDLIRESQDFANGFDLDRESSQFERLEEICKELERKCDTAEQVVASTRKRQRV